MKKGFAQVLFLLFFVVLVAGGFLLYKYIFSQKEKSSDYDAPEFSESSELSTMTNYPFRFQFDYDSTFVPPLPENMPSPPLPMGTYLTVKYPAPDPNQPPEWCDFEVLAFQGPDSFDLESQSLEDDPAYDKDTASIAGVQARKFVYDDVGSAISKSYYLKNEFFAYRIGYNYKKDGAHADFCEQSFDNSVKSFRFFDLPNFMATGNLVGGDKEGFALLYEKPGQPALSVDLKFGITSNCNLGFGPGVCDESLMIAGDQVELWGKKSGDAIDVYWLSKIMQD